MRAATATRDGKHRERDTGKPKSTAHSAATQRGHSNYVMNDTFTSGNKVPATAQDNALGVHEHQET